MKVVIGGNYSGVEIVAPEKVNMQEKAVELPLRDLTKGSNVEPFELPLRREKEREV